MILSQENITACKTPQVRCTELFWGTWSEEKLLFHCLLLLFYWGHYSQVSFSSYSSASKMKDRLTMSVSKSSLHPHYVNTAAAFGECQVSQSPLGRTQAHSFLHGTAWQRGWAYFPFQDTHLHPTCTLIRCKAFPRKAEGMHSQPQPCLSNVPVLSTEISKAVLGDAMSMRLLSLAPMVITNMPSPLFMLITSQCHILVLSCSLWKLVTIFQ